MPELELAYRHCLQCDAVTFRLKRVVDGQNVTDIADCTVCGRGHILPEWRLR